MNATASNKMQCSGVFNSAGFPLYAIMRIEYPCIGSGYEQYIIEGFIVTVWTSPLMYM